MSFSKSGQSLKGFWRRPSAERVSRCGDMIPESAGVGWAVGPPAGVGR